MKATIQMKVYYIDGTQQTFEWEIEQKNDPFNAVSTFKNNLKEQHILIKTEDGKLIVIHKNNVKYIEVNVAPDKMPSDAIVGARMI